MSLKVLQAMWAVSALAYGLNIPETKGRAFSLEATTPSAPEQFDPEVERLRLSAKFPTTSQGNAKEARSEKQHGSVLVEPQSSGLSFFVPTVIGNQTFNLIFDTGSADLWVYSNESSPWQSLDHPVYVPTASAELLPNYTWSIKYAFGESVEGIVYTDTVKAGPVVADKQAVQAATSIPFEFASDGILGLAPSIINTVQPVQQKTLFETLLPSLEKKIFAANLRVDGNPSTWDFGYLDQSKFKGDVIYTPVVGDKKYWKIGVGSYAVGKELSSSSTQEVGEVIIDSGTSLVYLPEPVVDDYYSHISGHEVQIEGSHTFPCNSTIPDLHFNLEETTLSIPGRDINYAVYDAAKGICVGAITTQLNMRYSVLGNLFMRNYYVVHDREEDSPRMGFASH